MFGLDLLFAAALFALPVAGVPLLLHLLFRTKAPKVPFSTLRFIRASIQQTSARRRVRQWLLLACRVLLIALLIWAVAQPVKRLQANWAGASQSAIAALVVDTSYSMQLKDGGDTLLQRADRAAQDLLAGELRNARVALFTSAEDSPERLEPASAWLSQWTPLSPKSSPRSLADRIVAAHDFLNRQATGQKWLVVLSDLQSKEFPRQIALDSDIRMVLMDLHPDTARSAGIISIRINPPQAIPGIECEIEVQTIGMANVSRAVAVEISNPNGDVLLRTPPSMASFNSTGRATVRIPISLPAEPWLIVRAKLLDHDAMPWDDERDQLLHVRGQQSVRLLNLSDSSQAARFVRLALDPNEGALASWPLAVREGGAIAADDHVVVVLLSRWPEQTFAEQLTSAARAGKVIILFLQPGIDALWSQLPTAQRAAWQTLLPAPPSASMASIAQHLVLAEPDHEVLGGLTRGDDLTEAQVRQMVRLDPTERAVTTLLQMIPSDAASSRAYGFLFRRTFSQGSVYTFATLPDSKYTNLATHPIFLPLLVRIALSANNAESASNTEIGQSISWTDTSASTPTLTVQTPAGEVIQVIGQNQGNAKQFVFAQTNRPGLYAWRSAGKVIGYSNVQPPASEAELVYRPADGITPPGANVIVARSLEEARQKMSKLAEPEPRWSAPIAIALMLLCLESLLGGLSRLK